MQWDFALLEACDALLYLAPSPGADRELALAKTNHLAIYYSLNDLPEAESFLDRPEILAREAAWLAKQASGPYPDNRQGRRRWQRELEKKKAA